MTHPVEDTIHDEAIAWHLAIAAEDFDEWDRFTAWLEADPRHNAIYEAVADADAGLERIVDLAPAPSMAIPANDEGEATPHRRGMWRMTGLAASLALVAAGSWIGYTRFDGRYTVTTAPGEMRTLGLPDGTRIALNGATSLVLDRHDPRVAELKAGEARFAVRHDADNPFELTVADQKIVDVGTVFNVRRNARSLSVEVAEGAVRYEDGPVSLRLNAGDTLRASGDRIVEAKRPVEAIGTWAQGRLVYQGQPLVDVVGDLSRARGIAIELGPDLAARTFTGVIQLDGDNETVRKRVAQLLGLKVSDTSDGWTISK
jgi:transmembrane sensor